MLLAPPMLTISCCSSAPKPPYHTAVDQYVFAACTTTPGAPATNDEHFPFREKGIVARLAAGVAQGRALLLCDSVCILLAPAAPPAPMSFTSKSVQISSTAKPTPAVNAPRAAT